MEVYANAILVKSYNYAKDFVKCYIENKAEKNIILITKDDKKYRIKLGLRIGLFVYLLENIVNGNST